MPQSNKALPSTTNKHNAQARNFLASSAVFKSHKGCPGKVMKFPPRGPFSLSPPGGPHGSTPIRIVRLASWNLERIAYAFSLLALASSLFPRRNLYGREGARGAGGQGEGGAARISWVGFRPQTTDKRFCKAWVSSSARRMRVRFVRRNVAKHEVLRSKSVSRDMLTINLVHKSGVFAFAVFLLRGSRQAKSTALVVEDIRGTCGLCGSP